MLNHFCFWNSILKAASKTNGTLPLSINWWIRDFKQHLDKTKWHLLQEWIFCPETCCLHHSGLLLYISCYLDSYCCYIMHHFRSSRCLAGGHLRDKHAHTVICIMLGVSSLLVQICSLVFRHKKLLYIFLTPYTFFLYPSFAPSTFCALILATVSWLLFVKHQVSRTVPYSLWRSKKAINRNSVYFEQASLFWKALEKIFATEENGKYFNELVLLVNSLWLFHAFRRRARNWWALC